MTTIELSGLLLVIVAAAWFLRGCEGNFGRVVEFKAGVNPAYAVLGAALLAFYSFVGFETSANLAEEIRDVRKTYPRALFGALLLAGAIYMAVAIGAAVVMPVEQLAHSTAPLLEVVKASGLGIPAQLFAFIALIAVANGALLTMIMASRLAYGMAHQGLLPRLLGGVLPERRTPAAAIVAATLVAIVLTLTGSLATLAQTVVLLLLFVFISTNLAVLVLRRDKVAADHFRVPTWVPVLGVASCLLLMTQQDAQTWLRAGALLLVGVVLYGISRAGGVKPLKAEDYKVMDS